MRDLNLNNRPSGFAASQAWPGWLGVIGGIWLIISPYVLGYSGNSAATTNDIILGIIQIILTGYWALTFNLPGQAQVRLAAVWLAVLAGVWLIISPWVLGYNGLDSALWNNLILGILFVIIEGYATSITQRFTRPAA